jgi:hypothetical protein
MTWIVCAVLASLSIWDYPQRHPAHERLTAGLRASLRAGDTARRTEICRRGVELLPDDPVWRYNLACALAQGTGGEAVFDELERAVDLGFRDANVLSADRDFRYVANHPRFREIVAYARRMAGHPVTTGPQAAIPAIGPCGGALVVGAHNTTWNFDAGAFDVKALLKDVDDRPYAGILYVNRDAGHSPLSSPTNFPGLTTVRFDAEARARGVDLDAANALFPYAVFGNCSRAYTKGPAWRSIPRSLMTVQAGLMRQQFFLYVSNQVWAYPACDDFDPAGTNGDVFASVAPYWIVSRGRSWSDRPCLEAVLEAAGALKPSVRKEILSRGLLAPTLQALLRKSLAGVETEDDYLTAAAHPTCFDARAIDRRRLVEKARAFGESDIPPLARIVSVVSDPVGYASGRSETTYATPCAWAFVMRAEATNRTFTVRATGGEVLAFAAVHGPKEAVSIVREGDDRARVTIDRAALSPTNRVDVAVFAKTHSSGWGAPAFVSFAVLDGDAPYVDPVLAAPSPGAPR